MRIGELAEAVGVSTRAVRHYHRVGLLPEPPRRANGYRTYDMRDVVRLARARRLTELGLSLEEAADVLADDEGRELPEILAELDADLARQEAAIRERRERLAELLRRGVTHADDAVSAPTAALLDRIATAFPDSAAARRDREYIAFLDRSGAVEFVAGQYGHLMDDPAALARAGELYRMFDDLADAAVDEPRIPGVAAAWAQAFLTPEVRAVAAAAPEGTNALGDALLDDLPPAQAEVVRRALEAAS